MQETATNALKDAEARQQRQRTKAKRKKNELKALVFERSARGV
jgi:hypothetical protein